MDEEEKALVQEANAPTKNAAVRIEDDDEEPMKIVKDYQRPAARYEIPPICSNELVSRNAWRALLERAFAECPVIHEVRIQLQSQSISMARKVHQFHQV